MAAILLEVAAEFGVGRERVLDGTDIDPASLAAPDTRIAAADHERMLANCLRETGEPGLALHFGSRIPVVALGVLGYALMCCRNLRELIDILARYHRLIGGDLAIAIEEDAAEVALRLDDGVFEQRVQPTDCEIFFAAAATTLRQLGLAGSASLRVELAYPEPRHAAQYRERICEDLRFDAGLNRLVIGRSALDLPLQFANPTLLKLYRQQCEDMLHATRRSAGYSADVRRWLLGTPGRFPPFEEAAAVLHMSPRTLRRRLGEEGTTYQQIVHELRRQLAETWLRDGMLSVAEIAGMLGYADISNFRRAFIGWTGSSPARYRRGRDAGSRQAPPADGALSSR
jgi:AraC-like DNA-binding protein